MNNEYDMNDARNRYAKNIYMICAKSFRHVQSLCQVLFANSVNRKSVP